MLWRIWRDFEDVWFDGGDEVGIERRDEVIVILFLFWRSKCRPWQVVNVPGVVESNVREAQRYRPVCFAEKRDEKVGTKGYGRRDRCLLLRQMSLLNVFKRDWHTPFHGRQHARHTQ